MEFNIGVAADECERICLRLSRADKYELVISHPADFRYESRPFLVVPQFHAPSRAGMDDHSFSDSRRFDEFRDAFVFTPFDVKEFLENLELARFLDAEHTKYDFPPLTDFVLKNNVPCEMCKVPEEVRVRCF